MPDYLIGSCTDPECGWTATIARIMPATRTDPSYLDGDEPDECPDCGADITTDVSGTMPEAEDYY